MARPKKDARLRKDADLRIPVTADQKRLISQAASIDGSDMAAWIRPLLLEAAKNRLDAKKRKR
jgi:uncharacterized protein (DUF1778 family)